MLSKKMQEALNSQINAEYHSSYLYLAMAAYCERLNLKGFGNWFRVQVQEEMVHVYLHQARSLRPDLGNGSENRYYQSEP